MVNFVVQDISPLSADCIPQEKLERAVQQTLIVVKTGAQADLTLVFSNDEQLKQLNRQFRGIDAPTDVLSFSLDENDPETGQRYLGDVVISLPRAQSQANAVGNSIRDELCLLVVHGVLHLLGYDHDQDQEKADMWAIQDLILNRLGCTIKPGSLEE